jgi:hypothetical protein
VRTGQLPLNFTSLLTPQLRVHAVQDRGSIGTDQLTGNPLDIAFDNQRNLGRCPISFALRHRSPGRDQRQEPDPH